MLPLEVFDFSVHLAHYLIVFLATCAGVQRRLETQSIEFLIFAKVFAESRIMLVLGIAEANPPLFAGGVYLFRPFSLQQFAEERGLAFVGERNHHAAAFAESIFVNK